MTNQKSQFFAEKSPTISGRRRSLDGHGLLLIVFVKLGKTRKVDRNIIIKIVKNLSTKLQISKNDNSFNRMEKLEAKNTDLYAFKIPQKRK